MGSPVHNIKYMSIHNVYLIQNALLQKLNAIAQINVQFQQIIHYHLLAEQRTECSVALKTAPAV